MDNDLHIAIIMDGNGRWAMNQGLPRHAGHKKGGEALMDLIKQAPSSVSHMTVFAFSTENWSRSVIELYHLFRIIKTFFQDKLDELIKMNAKVQFFGQLNMVPGYVRSAIQVIENKTRACTGLVLSIAVSYGARQEILQAAEIAVDSKQDFRKSFQSRLSLSNVPDPHILIRTGGHQRLSNYLLWQLAYTELFFTKTLWPDFSIEEFKKIIEQYNQIQRNFGVV